MRNDQIIPMVKHGLKNVANFSGRDPRIRFWPYFGFLYIVGQALSMLAVLPILQSIPLTPEDTPAENLEQTILMQFENMMLFGMITTGVIMLLLASAVTRRLHDRNMRGYWALIPAGLMLFAFWKMAAMFQKMFALPNSDVMSDAEATAFFQDFIPAFGANFAYLIALVILCVFLGLKGDAGENRFGPPVTIT